MIICIGLLFLTSLILSVFSVWCHPTHKPLFILLGGTCTAFCVILALITGRSLTDCIMIFLILLTITALAEKRHHA